MSEESPTRIWLIRSAGRWLKRWFVITNCVAANREVVEYVRVDSVIQIVEALESLLNAPIEFDDPRILYVTAQIDKRDLEAGRAALQSWLTH